MSQSWTPPGSPESPQLQKRRSWARRHPAWTTVLASIGGLVVIAIILSLIPSGGSGGQHVSASSPSVQAAASSSAPAPTPPPQANPDGTYQGSCDYLLGSDPVGGFGPSTAREIGEIDLKNTGNVGVVVKTRITWPQEGAAPITARKTVHLPFGASKIVRFKVPMTGDQVDLLQSWQERHDFNDGCTYHAAFTQTYGQVQS